MSTLDTMPGPTSRHFISQRLRMHYVDWGNPTAPPLLLVHGGRDHCRNWDWVAQALRSTVGPVGSAQCAIETAILDAFTRQAHMPLWAFLAAQPQRLTPT